VTIIVLKTDTSDHYLTFSTYRAKPGTESFDDFVRGDPEVQKKVFEQWNVNGTGPLAYVLLQKIDQLQL